MNRSTAFALTVAAVAATTLMACESLLGIQDVEIIDGGSALDGSGPDANGPETSQSDSSPQDASADAAPADSAPADSTPEDATACQIACANANPTGIQDLLADGGGMCLCGPSGACATACAGSTPNSNVCSQPPGMPTQTCVDCMGPAFLDPAGACHAVLTSCGMACSAIGMCSKDCGAP